MIAKRPVRNIADTPRNNNIGYPIKPNHIANNLYGIGVLAYNKDSIIVSSFYIYKHYNFTKEDKEKMRLDQIFRLSEISDYQIFRSDQI